MYILSNATMEKYRETEKNIKSLKEEVEKLKEALKPRPEKRLWRVTRKGNLTSKVWAETWTVWDGTRFFVGSDCVAIFIDVVAIELME